MSATKWCARLLLVNAACGFGDASAAISPLQANELAAACNACHWSGAGSGIPRIDGLPEDRIVQAMQAYRSGKRINQIMHVVATGLTEPEIVAVAHQLARPPALGKQ